MKSRTSSACEPAAVYRPQYADRLAINPGEPYSVTLRALRSGEPVQVSDTELDASFAYRAAAGPGGRLPLDPGGPAQHAACSAGRAVGVPPRGAHLYCPEINLLTSFANHAAMAIENATLYARSDMRLKEQTRRLEALIQSYQDGLILEDLQGRVLYANRRISDWVDLPYEEINGVRVEQLIERVLARAHDPEAYRQEIQAALVGRAGRRVEIEVNPQRQTRYLRLQIFDVTDTSGATIGRGQILARYHPEPRGGPDEVQPDLHRLARTAHPAGGDQGLRHHPAGRRRAVGRRYAA